MSCIAKCKITVLALSLLSATAAKATCPTTSGRFVPNGAEVTDSHTGLVWARCSVGQTWSGSTCTGSTSTPTHAQALTLAQQTIGWRLPNVKELSSLADKGCVNPAIDGDAFPATAFTSYWSSSPLVGSSVNVWVVVFNDGSVNRYGNHNGEGYAVRLVRASQ